MILRGRQITTLFISVLSILAAPLVRSAETYIAGNYVAGSPAPEMRTLNEARQLALKTAATNPGAFVVRGTGNSMLPLYSSGTLLVVKPVAFDELKRGMSVVFRKGDRNVAHLLVAKTKDGWRTTGLHNRRQDFVSVNEDNIRGVVVAAYTPVEGPMVALR